MSDAGNSNDDAGNAGDDANVPVESQAAADSAAESAVQSSGVEAPVDSDADESAAASQAGAAEQSSGVNAPVDSDADESAAASQADAAEQSSGVNAPVDSDADEAAAASQADAAEQSSGIEAPIETAQQAEEAKRAAEKEIDNLNIQWGNAGLEPWEGHEHHLEPNWNNVATQKFDPSYATLTAPADSIGIRLNTNPGLAMFFSVTIDALDMGTWTTCSGLGMSIEHPTRSDSAMSMFQNKLPGNISYSNITLGRPVTSDTGVLLSWFSTYHMLPIPGAGEITLLDQAGNVVMSWALLGVRPVSWKGPSLDAGSGTNLAMETLEIAHMGFM